MQPKYNKPDFICIGSQKAGTTWLFKQLKSHSMVWLPSPKELHFFTSEIKIRRHMEKIVGRKRNNPNKLMNREFWHRVKEVLDEGKFANLGAYGDIFAPIPEITGELTPSYSILDRKMVRRLAKRFPTTKILFFVREPSSRKWSSICMRARNRVRSGIQTDEMQVFQEYRTRGVQQKYDPRSFQSNVVEKWSEYFEDRFKVLFFDDIVTDSQSVRDDVSDFLKISRDGYRVDIDVRGNMHKKPSMPEEVKEYFARQFDEELGDLKDLLGGHATTWFNKNQEYLSTLSSPH